jgi:hypothetical protein
MKHFFGANLPPRMPPKVAALPREVLEHALTSAGMTVQDIRALLRSDAWRDLDPGTAKSFSSGNFLNLMEPFDLAPLILRKSSRAPGLFNSPQGPSEENTSLSSTHP